MLNWYKLLRYLVTGKIPDDVGSMAYIASKVIFNVYDTDPLVNVMTSDITVSTEIIKHALSVRYVNEYAVKSSASDTVREDALSAWLTIKRRPVTIEYYRMWCGLIATVSGRYYNGTKSNAMSTAYRNSIKLKPYIDEAYNILYNMLESRR